MLNYKPQHQSQLSPSWLNRAYFSLCLCYSFWSSKLLQIQGGDRYLLDDENLLLLLDGCIGDRSLARLVRYLYLEHTLLANCECLPP